MAKANIYLNFPGTTEEAFKLYKSVLGGDFLVVQKFKDTPEGARLSDKDKEAIMHISLPVGNNVLMGTDALDSMGKSLTIGNNFSISLEAESKMEAERIFEGLSKGGKETMPLQDTFWGAYFGMLTDKYGIQWMINHEYKKGNI